MNYTEKQLIEQVIAFRKEKKRENIKIYLVGGAVRDQLMGRGEINDKDYCITGVTEKELMKIFPEAKLVGDAYPVFLLHVDGDAETEIALARVEQKTGNGYHGTTVEVNIDYTILDDLKRRDLTINAIAIDLETGMYIDPYNGIKDIEEGIVRATSEQFKEDPLRIVRAARFAARYGYIIEPKTLLMMQSMKDELGAITGERYHLEVTKVVKDRRTTQFFYWLEQTGAMTDTFFLRDFNTDTVTEIEGHFKEFNALKVANKALFEQVTKQMDTLETTNDMERFAVLFQAFSPEEVDHVIQKWKMPTEYKQLVQFMNRYMTVIQTFNTRNAEEKMELLTELIRHPLTKQAESNEEEAFGWFVSAVRTRDKQVASVGEMIARWAMKMRQIKITPEEIKEKGLKGKEIGDYLYKKRKLLLN